MRLSLAEVAQAAGGTLQGPGAAEVASFHTDSREVVPGGLFFALRGAETDGRRYVPDALARGAAAVVLPAGRGGPSGAAGGGEVAVIRVPDTWEALYALASHVLAKVSPLVVGVTGSNGKTSTKEFAAAALGARLPTWKTHGNLNTETGVPLTILQLEPEHRALVLEMGMQAAGEIARLAELARPRVGIVTTVGTVHLEFFDSPAALARAKGELVAALPADGLVVLPADSPHLELLRSLAAAPVTTFGPGGDWTAEDYRPDGSGCRFTVRGVEVRLQLGGRHMAANALAALAAAGFAGVPLAEAAPALAGVTVGQRLAELPAPGGYTVVDDSYNASPESMLAAFETVAERPHRGRLLAVLGEMRELGALADQAHRDVGRRAGEIFDAVCVVDVGRGTLLAESAGGRLVADREAALAWVRAQARPGDTVLVKASHGVRLEELVAALMDPPHEISDFAGPPGEGSA
jgi:UDP-N-acetylmuramoyl-tripeptide--D-alanyl-D-alanine ligase